MIWLVAALGHAADLEALPEQVAELESWDQRYQHAYRELVSNDVPEHGDRLAAAVELLKLLRERDLVVEQPDLVFWLALALDEDATARSLAVARAKAGGPPPTQADVESAIAEDTDHETLVERAKQEAEAKARAQQDEARAELEAMMGRGEPPRPPEGDLEPFTIGSLVLRSQSGRLLGVTSDDLRVHLIESARELGWPVRGAENLIFGKDRSGDARLVLGGEVERIYQSELLEQQGWAVDVRWEVLDQRTGQVRYKVLTRFFRPGSWRDEDVDADLEVATGALHRVLRRPGFADLLTHAPEAATFEDALTLARCTDGPLDLPKGMDDAVARTVQVQAGGSRGTGVLVSPDGFVLTAAHVIEGGEPSVVLGSGLELPARVLRVEPLQDIALLDVDGTGHACVSAAAEAPTLGAPVFLVGYPLGELSVSSGVVSGLRTVDGHRFVQTDAATNPGNSGGPLLDAKGRLLGVMSWKLIGDMEGMAFAIPPDAASDVLQLAWGSASDDVAGAAPTPVAEAVVDEPDPEIEATPPASICLCRWREVGTDPAPLTVSIAGHSLALDKRTHGCVPAPDGDHVLEVDGNVLRTVTVNGADTYVLLVGGTLQGAMPRALPRTKQQYERLIRKSTEVD